MKKIITLILMLGLATGLFAQKARFMVLPFDNKANPRQRGKQEYTAFDSRTRHTDRYSVILREEVEAWIANQDGVEIVNRAELDDLNKELTAQNKGAGGVFDEATVINFGKLRGANYLVSGVILAISRRNSSFKGYNTKFDVQTDNMRFQLRITDIARSRQAYTGMYSIKLPVVQTNHGETTDDDIGGTLAEQVGAKLDADEKLQTVIQTLVKGAKAAPKTAPEPAAPAGLTVEISIAPKPDNCDVEIGGVMIGSSPVTTQLPDGQQVGITIRKDGYQTWERRVLVSKDMKLTPELMKLSPDQKSAD